MISKLKLVVASALVIAGFSATAFARNGDRSPEMKAKRKAEVLQKFDVNKDGALDDSERSAMREARVLKRFAMLDANKDGAITLDEMKAAEQGKRPGRGHRGDRDGFGGGMKK